jgi:HTH-type transcriptional regulator/antitoxin HigA
MSTTLLVNPAKALPTLLHNDGELEAYTNAFFQLTALENPSGSELEATKLLTLLVERPPRTTGPHTA